MSQPSIEEKLQALRELQREKERRATEARQRAYDTTIARFGRIPVLVLDGPDKDAQRKRFLAERGNPAFYIEHHIIDPPPAVESPGTMYEPDHADARDVTPPPYRPPIPPPAPPPALRDEPLTYSNAGIPRREHERELMRLNNFLDGEWGDSGSYPIGYPRGNRSGW